MAKFQPYKRTRSWIVVSDACPAPGEGPTWGDFIVAHRTFWADTSRLPRLEGASLVANTGINRAEFMAAIHGVSMLRLEIENETLGEGDLVLVTDSTLVFDVMRGTNTARAATRNLWAELDRHFQFFRGLGWTTYVKKGNEGEVKPADSLGRAFKNILSEGRRAPKKPPKQ